MCIGAAVPARAVSQHRAFVQLLRRLGAIVKYVPFVHGAYDSVFVKDSAVLIDRRGQKSALMARPSYDERRGEQAARASALEEHGFSIAHAPSDTLEGGDVVLRPGGRGAFFGHGFRSSPASLAVLENFLEMRVVPVRLNNPGLYHLDMALTVLADDTLVMREDALAPASVAAVRAAVGDDVLVVPKSEQCSFALNFVQVGRSIVTASASRWLSAALMERGWAIHTVNLDEFHHAGGSAACLVSRVHPEDAVTASSTTAIRSTAA